MEKCGREAEAKAPTAGDLDSRPGPDTQMEENGIPPVGRQQSNASQNYITSFYKIICSLGK